MSSMPRTAIWAALMRSWTAPGLPSAPLSEWTWQSMMPGISVPPAVSTLLAGEARELSRGRDALDLAVLFQHRLPVQNLLAVEYATADIQRGH